MNEQLWELTVNTNGDMLKNTLKLNGELIKASAVCLVTGTDNEAYLDVCIPIFNNNLVLKTDVSRDIDKVTISATSK